jgi:hypothetical protein
VDAEDEPIILLMLGTDEGIIEGVRALLGGDGKQYW